MRRLAKLAIVAVLAGCVAPRIDDPGDGIPPACGAGRLSGWIGQPVASLDEQYLPATVRILAPGTPVTEDFNPTRLNVDVDAAGNIAGFHCG